MESVDSPWWCEQATATALSLGYRRLVTIHEPPAHHSGCEPHFAGPCLVLDQTPAAVSPARRYRHRPARIQIFLSDHDDVAHQRGDFDHRVGPSQVIVYRSADWPKRSS